MVLVYHLMGLLLSLRYDCLRTPKALPAVATGYDRHILILCMGIVERNVSECSLHVVGEECHSVTTPV